MPFLSVCSRLGGTWRTIHCALIDTDPASECMCVGGGGVGLLVATPSPSLAGFATIYAKTTAHCSPGSSMITGIKLTYIG
jgi:hypothetical protein